MMYDLLVSAYRRQKALSMLKICALALPLMLCTAQNGFALSCSEAQTLQPQDTAQKECPSYTGAGSTPCSPDTIGPLSQLVLGGDCDPPMALRTNYGMGAAGGSMGTIIQGGRCGLSATDAPQCQVTPGIQNAPNAPASSPYTNPAFNQQGASLAGLSALPAMQCGGGVPLLNNPVSFGNNVTIGSLINLGSNITIGVPPVNLPNFNVTVPSIAIPTLSIPAPNLSMPNFSVPSVTAPSVSGCPNINLNLNVPLPNIQLPYISIPFPGLQMPQFNITIPNLTLPSFSSGFGANLKLPTFNMPSLNLPGINIGNLDFSIPIPDLSMPSLGNIPQITLPSLSLPSVCTPSISGGISVDMSLVNNLLSGGFLGGYTNPNGLYQINNWQSGSSCLGSIFSLPQNAVSLVVPGPASSTQMTSTTVSYPTAGSVINLPAGSPVGFNVDNTGTLTLPNGGSTVGLDGSLWTFAPNAMIVVMPAGDWGGGPGQVVVGTDLGNGANIGYGTSVEFPNGQIGQVVNGVLQVVPTFWHCDDANTGFDANGNCHHIFTLAPYVQNFTAVVTDPTHPNIVISASAIVASSNAPPITTQTTTPPAGSFLSIPAGTPVSFSVQTGGAIMLPSGGEFPDPNGNMISLGQNSALVALGNGTVAEGALLSNGQIQLPGNVTATVASDGQVQLSGNNFFSGTLYTYPASESSIIISTPAILVPQGASVPVGTSGTIAMPQT